MTTEIDRSDRYRLVPARGQHKSWFVYGAEEARKAAEHHYETTGVAVLVCKFPPGGLCNLLYHIPEFKWTRGRLR